MHFACCPRCQTVNSAKFSHAPFGRVKLNALRDRSWLERQLSNGRSSQQIAAQLGCVDDSVNIWIDKHGLDRRRCKVHDDDVAGWHDAGLAPGEISRKLDIAVDDVRRALNRTRGVTQSAGHHYTKKEWWIDRVVTRQMSLGQCAKDAGIKNQNASFWAKKFGLQEITAARSCRATGRRHSYKYPQLMDPGQLRALIEQHGTWEGVSIAITGKRTSATGVKAWWKTHFGAEVPPLKRHRSKTISDRTAKAWWIERLDRGLTTWQLAGEAEIAEKTVCERLRTFGGDLLTRGYRNNTAAERAKRSIAAAATWAKPRPIAAAQEGAA